MSQNNNAITMITGKQGSTFKRLSTQKIRQILWYEWHRVNFIQLNILFRNNVYIICTSNSKKIFSMQQWLAQKTILKFPNKAITFCIKIRIISLFSVTFNAFYVFFFHFYHCKFIKSILNIEKWCIYDMKWMIFFLNKICHVQSTACFLHGHPLN